MLYSSFKEFLTETTVDAQIVSGWASDTRPKKRKVLVNPNLADMVRISRKSDQDMGIGFIDNKNDLYFTYDEFEFIHDDIASALKVRVSKLKKFRMSISEFPKVYVIPSVSSSINSIGNLKKLKVIFHAKKKPFIVSSQTEYDFDVYPVIGKKYHIKSREELKDIK